MKKPALELLNSLLIYIPFQSVMMFIMAMLGCDGFFVASVSFLAVMIFSTIIDLKVRNGVLFILLNLVLILACAFLGSGKEKIVIMIFSFGTIVMQLAKRFKKFSPKGSSEIMTICFSALGIAIAILENEILPYTAIGAIVYVLVKYIYDGFSTTAEFLEINEKIADIPVNTIKKRTKITIGFFVVIISAGMFIGVNSGLGELISGFFAMIFRALKGIFAREKVEIDIEATETDLFDEFKNMDMSGLMADAPRNEAPAILEPIAKIIFGIAITIIAIGLLWTLFVLLKDFIRGLYDKEDNEDESEFLSPDETEFNFFKKTKTLFSRMKDSLPNDVKIRRLYKSYIWKHRDLNLLKNYTPYEISKNLNIDKKKNDLKIRTLYEKARYRKEETTSNDVALMKNLVKEK